MNAVQSRCAPLIDRAAPSLMPAMDIRNSNDRFTFWELWRVSEATAPTVAKYATTPDGRFHAGTIVVSVGSIDVLGITDLNDFLAALRGIEAGS